MTQPTCGSCGARLEPDGGCFPCGWGRQEGESAVEDGPSAYDVLSAALLDSAGLDAIPAPRPLIDGVLYLDSLAWLQGKPGNGKSLVALDMAGCIGTGESWQGFRVTQGGALYVAAEGASGLRWRVRAWEKAMGVPMTGVTFLPMAVRVDTDQWRALRRIAAEMRPSLIVLDTQARITVGLEENSAKDMGVLVDELERLRKASGACVVPVHHQGRNGEHMRGSSALDGAAATVIQVSKDGDLLTLKCLKQKDLTEFDEFRLRMVPTGDSVALMPSDGRTTAAARLATAKWVREWWRVHEAEPVSVTVLVKSGVVSETTFHRVKLSLVKEGIVVREGKGTATRYRLTADPTAGDSQTPTLKGGGSPGVGGLTDSHGTPTGGWESER